MKASLSLLAACLACDPEPDEGAGSKCEEFFDFDGCAHATQDDLPCQWFEVQHIANATTCEADVLGACLQQTMRGGTTGCGQARPYFLEDDDGNVALVSQCGDNPPRAFTSCGDESAPEACACWVAPE